MRINSLSLLFLPLFLGVLLLIPVVPGAANMADSLQQMEMLQQLTKGSGGRKGKVDRGRVNSTQEAITEDQQAVQPRWAPPDRTPSSIEISMQARLNSLLNIIGKTKSSVMNFSSVDIRSKEVVDQPQTIQKLRVGEQLRRDRLEQDQRQREQNQAIQNQAIQNQAIQNQAALNQAYLNQTGQNKEMLLEEVIKKDREENLKIKAFGGNLVQFGYELFSGVPTTFFPAAEIPVPPEYVLGPGDGLELQLYGANNESLSLVVDREGVIELPGAGPLSVAGMTFLDAKALIAEEVRQKMIGVTVSVAMGRLRSIRVFVLGDVNYPGSYVISGLSTVSHALFAAGGVSKKGSLRHVQLKRKGKIIGELDLYQFLLKGDNRGDKRLQPGDVVFIPAIGPVIGVAGQVTRPAIYEMKDDNSVGEIVAMAGGTLSDADSAHLQVDRVSKKGNRVLLDLDLEKDGGEASVHNGDIVMLYAFSGLESNRVSILGEVKRPGFYGMHPSMKLSDLLASAGGPTEQAYLKTAEITRYSVIDGGIREAKHFEIHVADMLAGDRKADVPLQPYDTVTIRQISNWKPLAHVELTGEFMHPGTYPVEEGEHLSSLLERAGGFTDKAYLQSAVFLRESVRIEEQRQLFKLQQQIESDLQRKQAEVFGLRDPQLQARQQRGLNSARKLMEQLKSVRATGRIIIRLKDVKEMKGTSFDISLRNGDRLHVPLKAEEVLVMGEVTNPTAFLHQKDFDRDDYIELAGGPGPFADDGRIYVIHTDGMVESGSGWGASKKISPGDTIVVPQEIDTFNVLDSMLDWSRAFIQISTGAATLRILGVL